MKTLAHKTGVLLEEPECFGPRSFAAEASLRFPKLATRLAEEAELIHLQMGTLGTAAREAIENGDFVFLKNLSEFLEDVLVRPKLHPEIENAMTISFLAAAEFEKSTNGRQAWKTLPDHLKNTLQSEG